MTHDYEFEKYLEKTFNKSHISNMDEYKEKLLIDYKDKSLEDLMNCRISKTSYGDVLKITNKEKINFKIKDNNFERQINENLKLLQGIGINTEIKLKKQGYNTIESLCSHDKYSAKANDFLSKMNEMSYYDLINLLNDNKYSKECKNNILKSISQVDIENFKFMDIETKGLSNVPIILIGVSEIKNNKIITSQYFLRDYSEEANIIDAYMSHLDEDSVHVTFNGKTFDIPFIKSRCLYNRMEHNLDLPHIDLRFFAKNIWGDRLPNCKLQTIEKEVFNINRLGDVDGRYIPDFYDTYLKENNIGPIVPIIEHNAQDIVSLASFLQKMYEEVN